MAFTVASLGGGGRTAPGADRPGRHPPGGSHPKENNCAQIYKEVWTNEVGHVKKVWVTPSKGWHPSEISKSDSDEQKGRK